MTPNSTNIDRKTIASTPYQETSDWIGTHRMAITRLFFLCMVALALFVKPAYVIDPMHQAAWLSVAFALVVVSVLGRLWCSLYLAGYKNGSLITTGPYSIVRNPLYIFSMLGGIGIGMATMSLTITLLIVLFLVGISHATINAEESKLESLFGAEYRQYRMQTSSILPRFQRFEAPTTYTISFRHVHAAFLDVVWFFIVFLLALWLLKARAGGWLPQLFTLP